MTHADAKQRHAELSAEIRRHDHAYYVEGRQVHKLARPIPSAPMYLEFVQSLPEGGLLKDFMNPKAGPEPLQIDWVKVFKIP